MEVVVDEFRNVLTLIAMELVLTVPNMQKRNYYYLRLAAGIILCLAAVTVYVPVHNYLVSVPYGFVTVLISTVWYVSVIALTGALLAFCHKINFAELVWIIITVYAAQHLVYVFVVEIVFLGLLSSNSVWGQLGLSVAVTAAVCGLLLLLFRPRTPMRKTLYVTGGWRAISLLVVFFIIFFSSTFVNQSNARRDGINFLSMISDFVNCLFVVVVQYVSQRNAQMRFEKEALQRLYENGQKQYEAFKNSVDYINVKCHDLKHEIAAMRSEGKLSTERFDAITENIAVYESFADTGNKTLDALVTDYNLLCLNNGISFSCMADAAGLSVMKNEDIYCLFGNMLDNATEYLKTVEGKEKKFMRLFVKTDGNLIIIHQENYFAGELTFSSGLPQTTKADKINHGFGMTSMRRITNRYGGEMRVMVENELFKTDIVISL